MADRATRDLTMVVHLLAIPNVQTTWAYGLDGFCIMTLRFAALLKRLGHQVILYGSEENEAPCDEFVCCISKAEQAAMIGEIPYQRVPFDGATPLFVTFNTRAATHIRGIKGAHDVICTLGGTAQMQVWQQNPELTCIEYAIGYRGVFAPFRVYQSHIWRHCVHGFMGIDGGREFDTVIPQFYNIKEFPSRSPEDYVLYCGRLDVGKGITQACQAAQAAGVRLVIIGHGNPSLITYGEHVGAQHGSERNDIMAGARAVLMPTRYIEPFGNVAAEAQLCGTPVIGPDYGAFVETIDHGVTGYRCAYLGEYIQAIDDSRHLDRWTIRNRAQRLWSMETAADSYGAYFDRLTLLRGNGWDTKTTPQSAASVAA